jgi:hypothetical protein
MKINGCEDDHLQCFYEPIEKLQQKIEDYLMVYIMLHHISIQDWTLKANRIIDPQSPLKETIYYDGKPIIESEIKLVDTKQPRMR